MDHADIWNKLKATTTSNKVSKPASTDHVVSLAGTVSNKSPAVISKDFLATGADNGMTQALAALKHIQLPSGEYGN